MDLLTPESRIPGQFGLEESFLGMECSLPLRRIAMGKPLFNFRQLETRIQE